MASAIWAPTNEEYHADRDHVSRSALEIFRRSRRLYHDIFISGELPSAAPTEAMILGTCSHMAILEPGRLDREVILIPESVLSANGSRAGGAWKAFAAEHAGACLLKQADYDAVRRIADSVRAHEYVQSLFDSTPQFEHCVTWQDDETGLMCKSLRDIVVGDIVGDIKTCQDASPKGFAKSAANLGYARQAAFYLDGHRANGHQDARFVFIAVNKEPPYQVACHELDAADVQRGARQVRKAMMAMATCLETDDWGDLWESGVNMIRLPKYVAYEDEYEME